MILVSEMGSIFARKLRIKLYGGNDQTFYPGAQVAGLVEYKSPSDDKISSLTIDLRGVTKILPRKGSQIREEHIELFHITEILLSQPMLIELRKPYTWSFTFTLPFQTGRDLSGKYTDRANPLFEEQPHSLPPSLGSDQSEDVRIEYQMYAVAKRPFRGVATVQDLQQTPVVHNIESLRYTPEVSSFEPEAAQLQRQVLQISPSRTRKFSLKGSGVKGQPLPGLTIAAFIPSMVALGKDISIRYVVENDTNSDNTEECRRLQRYSPKLISLSLRASTYRRTASTSYTSLLAENKVQKLGINPADVNSPVESSTTFSTKAVNEWPPSFKSYSISRAYVLLLDIAITDGKQDFEAEFEMPVTAIKFVATEILAARIASAVPPALPYRGPRDEDEELPPYQR